MKTLQTVLIALALSALSLTAAAQCDASFNYDTVNGGIQFRPEGGYYNAYHWDFGQGTADTSDLRNPTFGFAAAGTYNVCLTVTTFLTDSTPACTNTQCLQVQPTPCALAANKVTVGYTYVNNHFNLTFTDTSSSANGPLQYNWTFYGGIPNGSTVANPSVTYPDNHHGAQNQQVGLLVTDALGCSAQFEQITTVAGNSPCIANVSVIPGAPGTYTFADSLQTGTGFTYLWNNGNGQTSNSATPTFTFASSGYYNVCVIVSNSTAGCADTACTSVHSLCGVTASFNDTISGLTGNNVKLTSTSTTTTGHPLNYTWFLPSGSTDSANTASTNITTTGNGTESISLRVDDGAGCADSIAQIIRFGEQGPFTIWGQTNGVQCPATLYLILEDSIGHLVLVDSAAENDSLGTCYETAFSVTIPGTYYVKSALTTANPNYANYLPTYYTSALSWVNATGQYVSDPNASYQYPIAMQAGVNTGGPGFIGGYVSEGAGLEARPQSGGAVNDPKSLGDALAGIQINLTTETGQAVAYTHTDANGHYQFPNLAYGTYVVFTDVLNSKPSPITVILSAQNPSDSLANDSVQQSAVTSIADLTTFTLDRVYPNPVVNNVTLAITSAAETSATIKLVDMLGRTQLQKPVTLTIGQNTFTWPTNELANGVYQLLLQTTTKTIAYKLVKVK